ncbi:hypothetical protein ACEN33_02740 [Ruoffia sp. FAM 24228]|uniref:hypothetical protein n=1 Tax=unclassified Ruoffia TaxID=2862149 RepID=UPI003883F7FC
MKDWIWLRNDARRQIRNKYRPGGIPPSQIPAHESSPDLLYSLLYSTAPKKELPK